VDAEAENQRAIQRGATFYVVIGRVVALWFWRDTNAGIVYQGASIQALLEHVNCNLAQCSDVAQCIKVCLVHPIRPIQLTPLKKKQTTIRLLAPWKFTNRRGFLLLLLAIAFSRSDTEYAHLFNGRTPEVAKCHRAVCPPLGQPTAELCAIENFIARDSLPPELLGFLRPCSAASRLHVASG
jgi:hypothetical protein